MAFFKLIELDLVRVQLKNSRVRLFSGAKFDRDGFVLTALDSK